MAKGKRKLDAKAFAQQKRHRRQLVTFYRMCRYGVNNFSRNAWLTVAATAIMTITLLIIFLSVVSRNILVDTSSSLSESVQMSVYLKTETPKKDVDQIASELSNLSTVTKVIVETQEQAQQNIAKKNSSKPLYLDAIKEMKTQLPWTVSVTIVDINDTKQLSDYVANSQLVINNSSRPASFNSERKQTIERIGQAVGFAQNVGLAIGGVFVAISMLIIFNTIRMAIFNRREEIQMMKLIGAEKSFIRGPFLVEAMMYGFFAAIIASIIGFALMYLIAPSLQQNVNIQPTIDMLIMYSGFVLLAMIVIGCIIGCISSLLATRRYLKL